MILLSEYGASQQLNPIRYVFPLRSERYGVACLVLIVLLIADGFVSSWAKSSSTYWENFMENYSTRNQCLYLSKTVSKEICNKQTCQREIMIRNREVRLKFCSSYSVYSLISASDEEPPSCRVTGSGTDCHRCLDDLVARDADVARSIEDFEELLERFDCNEHYSVKWNCSDCKMAYIDWLCATKLTYYHSGQRVLPCGNFCSRVEEMCPFFRPDNDDTHAGDPSFICKDPAIVTEQKTSLYGKKPACYSLCHLRSHSMDCWKIDISVNKDQTLTNSTSPSRAQNLHSYQVWDLVQSCLVLWILRTLLQYTSIGLT